MDFVIVVLILKDPRETENNAVLIIVVQDRNSYKLGSVKRVEKARLFQMMEGNARTVMNTNLQMLISTAV